MDELSSVCSCMLNIAKCTLCDDKDEVIVKIKKKLLTDTMQIISEIKSAKTKTVLLLQNKKNSDHAYALFVAIRPLLQRICTKAQDTEDYVAIFSSCRKILENLADLVPDNNKPIVQRFLSTVFNSEQKIGLFLPEKSKMPLELLVEHEPPTTIALNKCRTFKELSYKYELVTIYDFFKHLGIAPPIYSVFCGFEGAVSERLRSTLSDYLANNDKDDLPLNRSSIKRLRSHIYCDDSTLKRIDPKSKKSLASIVYFGLDKYQSGQFTFEELYKYLVDRLLLSKWSPRTCRLNPKALSFIMCLFPEEKFAVSRANGQVSRDTDGVIRINTFSLYKENVDLIKDEDCIRLIGMKRAQALSEYNAIDDVDLLIKYIKANKGKNAAIIDKWFEVVEKVNSYHDINGLNSLSMIFLHEGIKQYVGEETFTYKIFTMSVDMSRSDLWDSNAKNHFIVLGHFGDGWGHWMGMGYATFNEIRHYFIYCSYSKIPGAYEEFTKSIVHEYYLRPKGTATLRAPTVQNQKSGTYCGFWTTGVAASAAFGDFPMFNRFFNEQITNKELLRYVRRIFLKI